MTGNLPDLKNSMDPIFGAHGERPASFDDQFKTSPKGLVNEFVRAGYGSQAPQNVYEPTPPAPQDGYPPNPNQPARPQQIPGNGRIWQTPQPAPDYPQQYPQPGVPITPGL